MWSPPPSLEPVLTCTQPPYWPHKHLLAGLRKQEKELELGQRPWGSYLLFPGVPPCMSPAGDLTGSLVCQLPREELSGSLGQVETLSWLNPAASYVQGPC